MVEIAETLSQGTDLLRVDLYEIGNQIVFGELTNYPEGEDTVLVPDHLISRSAPTEFLPAARIERTQSNCNVAPPTDTLAKESAERR
jgi:hypothetical protein